jgi:hypothetical protein
MRGRGIIMSRNINVPGAHAAQATLAPCQTSGGHPDFGNISQYPSIGDSWFDGLMLSLGTHAAWAARSPRSRPRWTMQGTRSPDATGTLNILGDKGAVRQRPAAPARPAGPIWVTCSSARRVATGVPFHSVTATIGTTTRRVNDQPVGMDRNSARQPATSSFDPLSNLSRFAAVSGSKLAEAFSVFITSTCSTWSATFRLWPDRTRRRPTVADDPRLIQLGVRWSF